MLEFPKVPFLVLHFSYYTLMTLLMSSVIYADDAALYSKCNQATDVCQQLELASELESDLRDTVDWGRKFYFDFNTQLVSLDQSNNSGAIDVFSHFYGSVLERKPYFKMLGLFSPSKLDWGLYIVCIAKTVSQKIGAFIRSMTFFSPDLCKSTTRPFYTVVMSGVVLLADTWIC